jgi:hypothetical protein
MKDALGGAWSAVLFGAVHYFQPLAKDSLPKSRPAGEHYDPLLGFRRLGDLVEAWTEPRNATLGFLSLVVFALALNRLRERTGTLYLGIGIHAALVFALEFYRRFLVTATPRSPWIFGGSRIHDGLLGLAALGVLLLLAYVLPLPPPLRREAR